MLDPYANAFRDQPIKGLGPFFLLISSLLMFLDSRLNQKERKDGKSEEVWERKYEVDSLCYFLSLSYKYWKATGAHSQTSQPC